MGRTGRNSIPGARGDLEMIESGPLFLPINKGGKMALRRMSDQGIWVMIQKRSKEAGLQKLSPRDLRRSICSDLLDLGADIASVQQLAGHSNTVSAQGYGRRGESAKRKAAELLLVPFVSCMSGCPAQ